MTHTHTVTHTHTHTHIHPNKQTDYICEKQGATKPYIPVQNLANFVTKQEKRIANILTRASLFMLKLTN